MKNQSLLETMKEKSYKNKLMTFTLFRKYLEHKLTDNCTL